MRPLPKEPDSDERKKKTLKSKMKVKENKDKPNISYPTNFEHTVHVGFDAVTGEFTVSFMLSAILLLSFKMHSLPALLLYNGTEYPDETRWITKVNMQLFQYITGYVLPNFHERKIMYPDYNACQVETLNYHFPFKRNVTEVINVYSTRFLFIAHVEKRKKIIRD